jgi:ligand-binding sensor domain-containing protein/signal transduction histidine kinase
MVTRRGNPIWRGSLAFLLALASSTMLGATNSAWFARVWQSEEGLPENNVTGLAQTADGYLWISSHNGLVRFDGVQFERVPLPLAAGRNQPLIRALLLGRNSQVWLAMEGGMAVRVALGETNAFTSFRGLSSFRPTALAQGADGSVWIGYTDGSVCRIEDGGVTRFTARDGLSGAGACWVTSDGNGQVWFAKAGRIGVFREGEFTTLLTVPEKTIRLAAGRTGGLWICAGRRLLKYEAGSDPQELGELPVEGAEVDPTVLFEARGGALWIGTSAKGLYRYDGTNCVRVPTSHGDIESMTDDREGNVWVGTGGGGLNRLRRRVLELQGTETGLPFETVQSVCEDASGTLWATTQNGGLARQVKEGWKTFSAEEGWSGARATCVAGDNTGVVWIGTYRSGLYRWEKGTLNTITRTNGLAGNTVRALLPDRAGNLWIGLESTTCLQELTNGQLRTYTQPTRSRVIRAMAEDTAGNIWLGTSDGYLLRVSQDTLIDETPRTLPAPKPIRCLYATPDGSLWIGYANGGLGRLRNGRFERIGIEQGLHDAYICAMAADNEGAMWFAGDHGIFQVRQRELEAVAEGRANRLLSIVYGRDEGLPSLQASYGNGPNAARSRDGRIFFPMRTGLAVVHPDRVQPNRIPPPVLVARVVVDGRPPDPRPSQPVLHVAPGHRRLEVEYTALTFVAPENVHFQHRLEGWDDAWIDTGTKRSVSYSRLPAGRYVFRVTACNNAGVWNENGAAMSFVVAPFFWQTWWFRLSVGTVLVGGLVFSIRLHERRKVRRKLEELERRHAIDRERARIARDIHDELGAGLTQIGLLADLGLSHTADPEQKQTSFSKIGSRARTAASALDEIVWASNPRNDNLPRLADYLCQLADDCFESAPVRCRKEVPTGLPAVPVGAELRHQLALTVKEALTNALKHSSAGTVRLRLTWNAPELLVSVEDDGAGFEPGGDSSRGNGLRNQAARMQEIGGTVGIKSAPGQGTHVILRVSLPPE